MVIGGNHGMGGAGIMAAEACARTGAGLSSLATQPQHIAAALSRCPEVMSSAVTSGQELDAVLDKNPGTLVLGPGLGQGPWAEQMAQKAFAKHLPMVVDADALNIIKAGRVLPQAHRDHWILTPHPGEAARLLDISTAEVQADRFAAAKAIQQQYGGVVVLKGAGTVIYDGQQLAVCPYGNPGMASGGMGDVLSGIIGGLLAQGLSLYQAAVQGCCIHGHAADIAARDGQRGLLATDLIAQLRAVVNGQVAHG
jgi:NAD(P)H-hydrate epimerase